jgi:hypothetical protein
MPAMSAHFDGGCLCGAIRFRATAMPVALSRCHCRSCRLAVGSAGVSWAIFRRTDFALLRGALVHYRSSPGAVRTFCATCGTSISYEPTDSPENIEITSSTFDEPNSFAPTREVWVSHRLIWEQLDRALPQFQEGSS